jgi:predicted DNA-binding transcriptional regulator AlpA
VKKQPKGNHRHKPQAPKNGRPLDDARLRALAQNPLIPAGPRLIRVKEMCARLSMTKGGLYRWIADGKIVPPLKLGYRIVGWRETDLTDILDKAERERAERLAHPVPEPRATA